MNFEEMIKMQSTIQGLTQQVINTTEALGDHYHPPHPQYSRTDVGVFLKPSCLDINMTLGTKTMPSLEAHQTNIRNLITKFTNEEGKCYINSVYNSTN